MLTHVILVETQWSPTKWPQELLFVKHNSARHHTCCFKALVRDFPVNPVAKTPCFHCRGEGLIPGWGTKISHAPRIIFGMVRSKNKFKK